MTVSKYICVIFLPGNHHKAAAPYRIGDHVMDARQSDPRPPVSPLAAQPTAQTNGPTVASALPNRISQGESQASNRPRAYSSPGQPIYHNWKLKRALKEVCIPLYFMM